MNEEKENINNPKKKNTKPVPSKNTHLGTSRAFEETENPFSYDDDKITDEKLDEMLEKPDSNFGTSK